MPRNKKDHGSDVNHHEGEDIYPRLHDENSIPETDGDSVEKKYFVYMLACSNNSFYTGYTTDVAGRYEKHLAGKTGAKFTRSFKPAGIAAAWSINGSRGDAMRVESFIKGLDRSLKEKIAADPSALQVMLAEKYSIEIYPA